MNAIIVTGGKQYKVAEGDTLFIEKLEAEAGQEIVFDHSLENPISHYISSWEMENAAALPNRASRFL